jgi:hypothetical protein
MEPAKHERPSRQIIQTQNSEVLRTRSGNKNSEVSKTAFCMVPTAEDRESETQH